MYQISSQRVSTCNLSFSSLGQYLFLQHGGKVIVVAQFVPILRTIAGVLAGLNMMPWRRFVVTNVVGACIWAASYGYAAYAFGHQFRRLEAPAMVVLGIMTAGIITFGVIFIRRHEAQLIAKAQAALPGPLDVPQRSQRSAKLADCGVLLENRCSRIVCSPDTVLTTALVDSP